VTNFPGMIMQTQRRAHSLELKVPPVALMIIAAFWIWLGVVYFPELSFEFPLQWTLSCMIGVLGVVVCTLGVVQFKRAETTVNPTKPEKSSSLVKTGIYRQTRNPMYLGFLLLLGAWAGWMGNVISFLALPVFVLYLNQFQIRPEERALSSLFGDDFREYRCNVRRWI
jgi:protein-S-isoprenylcysteine O-methyltransferase Ste14